MSLEKHNYLLDTYAWIEYFLGSEEGESVKNIIEKEKTSTSIISIAELSDKYYRENLIEEWKKRFLFIINNSKIVDLSLIIAQNVGKTKKKLREQENTVGLADAIIYETAKKLRSKIVTGDIHFRNLENVIFLKK